MVNTQAHARNRSACLSQGGQLSNQDCQLGRGEETRAGAGLCGHVSSVQKPSSLAPQLTRSFHTEVPVALILTHTET